MYILGLDISSSKVGIALLKDDKILCAFQEERFTRIKFDNSFPINSIKKCLEFAKIKINDVSCYKR